ncbi:MAG: FAD-binding domain-containing protein [Porticoccaceae bacterium]
MKLVWFRNDLRTRDNPALFRACEDANGQGVLAIAVLCPGQWQAHDDSSARVQFWLANLRLLEQELACLNIPLQIIRVDTFSQVPEELLSLALRFNSDALYLNREYCLNENLRDKQVVEALRPSGIKVYGFHGDVVIPPGDVMTGQGTAFRVFTPFSRAWRREFLTRRPSPLPAPPSQPFPAADFPDSAGVPEFSDYPRIGQSHWLNSMWPAGSDAAHQRLQDFVAEKVADYSIQRDFPGGSSTSELSPYLSCGAISARQCFAALESQSDSAEWLDSAWVTEIIWREFYRHLMVHFPALNRWEPFRPEVEDRISWRDDDHLFAAWCQGETGYPIVDAGMKQLLATGWMHNRVRMITASFLTKLLRQDWRRGARFFMQNLIDGDFASNLGGWQWCASVGADAAPYFRIFNPMRQAERFDPKGEYVARWLPELAVLEGAKRHDPELAQRQGRPAPIIDYARARADSLASYRQ